MITKRIRVLLASTLIALMASVAQSQVPTEKASVTQWRNVQSLSPGEQVQVRILKKKAVHGSIVSANDSELIVSAKSGQVNIARSEILKIKVRRDSARLKKGLLGAAIGATAGVVGIVAADGALTDGNGTDQGAAFALGVVGGGIGFALKAIPTPYSTIYKAP